jgi:hypothetical protein
MLVVPVASIPNQQLQVQLDGQACTLNIYQLQYGTFMDVLVNGIAIISGVICQNINRIVRDLYLGFSGDFIWLDTQGTTDPVYTGFGTRYQLLYLEASDLGGEG